MIYDFLIVDVQITSLAISHYLNMQVRFGDNKLIQIEGKCNCYEE